jgi:heme/copper-type cytochrome/quinol oxidase subunit 2
MISQPLADAIFWIAVAACTVAQVAIVRSVATTPTTSTGSSRARRAAEIAWAVAPAVALALVLGATWRTLHPRADSQRAPVMAEAST